MNIKENLDNAIHQQIQDGKQVKLIRICPEYHNILDKEYRSLKRYNRTGELIGGACSINLYKGIETIIDYSVTYFEIEFK